ncbi:MAG: photosynthesis system II assembly factor Ycf48 [Microcoleaceae cyanobacterium]
MKFLKKVAIAFAAILLCTSCKFLPDLAENPWQTIPVATQSNLLDIAFTEDAAHGWIVGSSATLLETTDAGETWETKSLALDTDQKARFTSISFRDSEGWIAGEPGILLHSTDAGESWNRIVLSNKLPGEPFVITALDSNSAEMMTDVGAIYQTQDGGQSWKAMVEEAVGVVRNVARSEDGRYITVSAKGNFYSTWAPGDRAWTPRNRYSSKKLENMGFGEEGRLWMLDRGGELRYTVVDAEEGW